MEVQEQRSRNETVHLSLACLELGEFDCASCDGRIARIRLPNEPEENFLFWVHREFSGYSIVEGKPAVALQFYEQLSEYLRRQRKEFTVPFTLRGTPFQQQVWQELQRIPYGEVISYQELAVRIGMKGAVRAVGNANGANPLPILVPCHRVIGSNGKLVGYGGGLGMKSYLLQLESRQGGLLFQP